MTNEEVARMCKTVLEAQIVAALNSAPDTMEKLIKAALSEEVYKETGTSKSKDWGSYEKCPYLDWLVLDEIRGITRTAVTKVIAEFKENITDNVRKALTSEKIVEAVAGAFANASQNDWQVKVVFGKEDK